MGHVAAVYHVREGDASLEVLHFSGKHFQGRVWNKDTFSKVQNSSSTVHLPVSAQNPKRGSFTVVTSLMAIDKHQLRGRRT